MNSFAFWLLSLVGVISLPMATTPNIQQMADEGLLFTKLYKN